MQQKGNKDDKTPPVFGISLGPKGISEDSKNYQTGRPGSVEAGECGGWGVWKLATTTFRMQIPASSGAKWAELGFWHAGVQQTNLERG